MSEVFNAYAQYYDLFYDDKNYPKEVNYITKIIKTYKSKAKNVLELGCGTGKHAALLAKAGYSVHGVDLSIEMLSSAETRSQKLEPVLKKRLSFAQGDARTYRVARNFDVVMALFHILSYQTTNQDLLSMLKTAAKHLKKDGVFIFDCWYGPAVLTEKPEVRVKERENKQVKIVRIAKPLHWPNQNIVDVNYQLFVMDKKAQQSQEINEVHRMRYLFTPEIEQLLSQTGFKLLNSEEWLTGKEPGEQTWGVCFVAQKLKD